MGNHQDYRVAFHLNEEEQEKWKEVGVGDEVKRIGGRGGQRGGGGGGIYYQGYSMIHPSMYVSNYFDYFP